MLMGYIPTLTLFSDGELTFIKDDAFAMMEVEALNLVGQPYEIKGLSRFRMQYNPDVLEDSASTANYAEHRGLGSQSASYHYLYSETGSITIPVVCVDSYEGPPHATRDSFGNIVYKDFENLFDVVHWFKNLTHNVEAWKKPPYVWVSFGRWNKFGVVTEVSKPRYLSFYRNGDPEICEFSFTLMPDVIVTHEDKSFFNVE